MPTFTSPFLINRSFAIPSSAKDIPACLHSTLIRKGLRSEEKPRMYTNAYYTLLNKNDNDYNELKEIYDFYIEYCEKCINEKKRGSVMDARFHKKRLTDAVRY